MVHASGASYRWSSSSVLCKYHKCGLLLSDGRTRHACHGLRHCLSQRYHPAQILDQPKRMSKMHSWPPMEQGIERPMSDLAPVFSMPVLPKILRTVPEEEPVARAATLAKARNPCGAVDASGAQNARRQAEELRRVLRSLYKDHFQMQTAVR